MIHHDLPRELAEPRVIVYHSCPTGATGSVLGPHDALAYWWATSAGIRLVPAEPIDTAARAELERAVIGELGMSRPSEAVRRHQDAMAEVPDL